MAEGEVSGKVERLVRQLLERTEGGTIEWRDTPELDTFRAQLQNGMVRVQKTLRLDEEGHETVDYSLTLLDKKGRELEDYNPELPSQEMELARLWTAARRSARGTVSVLDDLLEETGSPKE